jgi:multiple sugar transport system permease protein
MKTNKSYILQKKITEVVLPYILMTVIAFTMMAPFIWMISTSLKERGAVFTVPPEWIPRTQIATKYKGRDYRLYKAIYNGKETYFIRISLYKNTADVVEVISIGNLTKTKDGIFAPQATFSKETIQIANDTLKPFKKVYIRWFNYVQSWTSVNFPRYYINSIIVAVAVTFGQVFTSSLAAFAFARLEFPGRDKIFLAYLGTMMIPSEVTIIPIFILLKILGWIDTYQALILPGIFTAYGTFLLRQFFLTIPKDLEDAAVIDGCSKFRIYATIILPLSKAALATLTTFVFMGSWNNFMWPLIVTNSDNMKTLPIGLASFQGQFSTDYTLLMAASMIVLIPVIIVYIFNQRFFTEGIVLSGLKA